MTDAQEIRKLEKENARLRAALESLRIHKHKETLDFMCRKLIYSTESCTCGMDEQNRIIDRALGVNHD